MAMDGSFCLQSELDKFLVRCPKLRSVGSFSVLLDKDHMLTEEEAVDALASVFLHPDYTIPMMGCFRAIARKIVDKVVTLLKLVPNLGSNACEDSQEDEVFMACEKVDDVEDVGVIEFYSKRGRGLDLHELACFAFCRVLDLASHLKSSLEYYYDISPSPFVRIPSILSNSELSAKSIGHVVFIARTTYRSLLKDPEFFSGRWNWCCFLDLILQIETCVPGDNIEMVDMQDVRWCCQQILSILLKIPTKPASFSVRAGEALDCLLRWHEFCCDTLVEMVGWCIAEPNNFRAEGGYTSLDQQGAVMDFSSELLEIEPINSGGRHAIGDCNRNSTPFVLTSAVKRCAERVALAVSQKWPVLLYGPAGSGKTALVDKLAMETGNQVLSLHMDEQIDGRTLLGTYVCTQQPGEFIWKHGSLTQAVMNGLWVLFENIDQAPSDVQAVLLPLLEGGRTLVAGNGELIQAAQGFRIFATVSSPNFDMSRHDEGRDTLSALWRRVMVRLPSSDDLVDIVNAWYPDLRSIAGKLIETLEEVNKIYSGTCGFDLSNRFSTRHLLKWCKRIAGSGLILSGNELSASTCNAIFLEAADIFLASSDSIWIRKTWLGNIGKIWGVPVSLGENLYYLHKPIFMESYSEIQIGRVCLQRCEAARFNESKPFVKTCSSLRVLERIACSVKWNEPVLLVGETGSGKTTLVQNLATKLGHRLTVLNLSQQSDVTDLFGGFKPTDLHSICTPLYEEFENLFFRTFPERENGDFITTLKVQFVNRNWVKLLRGFDKVVRKVVEIRKQTLGSRRKTPLHKKILTSWKDFALKLQVAHRQISASSGMLFSFVEGTFVTALRNGDWILLDEVNLAPPETLQRIIGVLDGQNGSLCLAERGDVDYLYRHSGFRLFACMNPATDAGKRDLPFSLRSRFTEYFVDDVLDDNDLSLFVSQFVADSLNKDLVSSIVSFYKAAKKDSEERLQDGANQKPQYSLRSLYRALEYTNKARRKFKFQEALYDGFCMFFKTLLDRPSAKAMDRMIVYNLLGGEQPRLQLKDYLVTIDFGNYVLTESVRENLKSLAKAVLIKRYPVLLQGPTSSGKTSLVKYLAAITGHKCVRINNHEHTDLQEYLGSYITDSSGKLVFHEGFLVKAVRNGDWVVLDELNLAPSDVLEALNRLLDDNRELFIPELQETIHAHPDFMLFATQNPPTIYGGRKILSRAFRNRFVEIHVDEIPEGEWSTILSNRCKVPESYAKKMVEVMKELQLRRQSSKVFAGKHGFITPRDLFRWADRFRTNGSSYDNLAVDGYLLLAERLREKQEKEHVRDILKKHLNIKKLDDDEVYKQGPLGLLDSLDSSGYCATPGNIVFTKSMQRLYFLVERCYKMREPVLLVGETGGGKTTVCQLLSKMLRSKLHILNCHQYTETSDFIGGFFPIRERSRIAMDFKNLIEQMLSSKVFIYAHGDSTISSDVNHASLTLEKLEGVANSYRQNMIPADVDDHDLVWFKHMKDCASQLHQKWQTIFMWQDGSLVQAMKNGDLYLVDEISLADDSVLERLNSVLEPERELLLAEKGGSDPEKITAHLDFFLLATMNPGGDYGKKELSPALRNRFTEIWVPPVVDLEELRNIAEKSFSSPKLNFLVDPLLKFWKWYNAKDFTGRTLTVRDLLSWVAFINTMERSLQPDFAFLHGAFLVLLDGLTMGTGISKHEAANLRDECLAFLIGILKESSPTSLGHEVFQIENYGWGNFTRKEGDSDSCGMKCDQLFGIHPFYVEKGHDFVEVDGYEFLAPTTRQNLLRVLRAMQLVKPVLVEGSPGVGKTSLIIALGKFSGHKVVRINLSEQTDMMDLLGSDLPVESEVGMQFAWSDGILLQAIKEGSWVLLDELNLAPQSVLEGLNAILDHRAEVFIPDLGQSFKCPQTFRVFACQNPSYQGGGRKGLPKSFLNRFTKVYVDELVEDDYRYICSSLFPKIPDQILEKLVLFNKRLYEDTMLHHKFAQDGSPWEFNLRDVIRSCQIMQGFPDECKHDSFLNTVYIQRMRTAADRRKVIELYEQIFGFKPSINPYPRVQLNDRHLVVGNACVKRNTLILTKSLSSGLKILPGLRNNLEAAAQCVQQGWLCILVGSGSSGKTSLVRLLAQLTGNVLHEINLSSATDISELLGYFDQYNVFRNFQSIVAQVESYVNKLFSQKLGTSANVFLREKKDLVNEWLSSLPNMSYGQMSHSGSVYAENWSTSLSLVIKIVKLLRQEVEDCVFHESYDCHDLDNILQRIEKLQEIKYVGPLSVKFEWAAGLLINAVEKGEWIMMEDANLCNPTVLDRINSLVESNGSITVNECGNIDGKPLVLHPHRDFRLFLTVNPKYGDVSRAMRNRGVEIVMMQPIWLQDGEFYQNREIELNDIKRFLALSMISGGRLVDSMAKAHIYAIKEGLRINSCITYLELARWIQLFQQLLINGNHLIWSLQLSWEHTYLSTLGESEGWDIVNRAKLFYLSANSLSYLEQSLCLPGGLPIPLMLKDFVLYPKETCVRQNCMYLEYVGSQYAFRERSKTMNRDLNLHLSVDGCKKIYLMGVGMFQGLIYPKTLADNATVSSGKMEYDCVLSSKEILFSASWVLEQATEDDLEVYLCWFRWFNSQLHPYCQVFTLFLQLLGEELSSPIWKSIKHHRREILSCLSNQRIQYLPMLSSEFVELVESTGVSAASVKLLSNAINCVGFLRRSLWQWNAETMHVYDNHSQHFKPVLRSLRKLEKNVLEMIVESPSFEVFLQAYADLLEGHISFWKTLLSPCHDHHMVYLCFLNKKVRKLQEFFPQEVEHVLENLRAVQDGSWYLNSANSLLWTYGGHPFLPSCPDLYYKLQQIVSFCKLIWQKRFIKDAGPSLVDIAVASNPELRVLTMQGVCMVSHILDKYNEDEQNVIDRLQEIFQMLLKRFGHEKRKLEINRDSEGNLAPVAYSVTCCILFPELMCNQSCFASWRETAPILDQTSLFLDLLLLEKLSKTIVVDPGNLRADLSNLCDDLRFTLHFSLEFSSRSPLDLVPHQKLLWVLDAWESTDAVHIKIASSILEMWFRWHSFLWQSSVNGQGSLKDETCISLLPYTLFTPTQMETVQHMLASTCVVKDIPVYSLKLRVASCNIWRSAKPGVNLYSTLLSSIQSLLQQIIYAHRKSFGADQYDAIRSIYASFQENKVKDNDIQALVSILAASRHQAFTSILDLFINPLLKEAHLLSSAHVSPYNLGCGWLRLGVVRLQLMLSSNNVDPAFKYTIKCLQLEEAIASIELEMKVRQECNYFAGSLSRREICGVRSKMLEKLQAEKKRVQEKIVFRPDHGKFKQLKSECDEFRELAYSSLHLMETCNDIEFGEFIDQAGNWQATANSFIERLSDEYIAYEDIIQPIQVSVFEMKLGLSLISSSVLEKRFLDRVQQKSIYSVQEAICSFMRFTVGCNPQASVEVNFLPSDDQFYTVKFPSSICSGNFRLLEKLTTDAENSDSTKMVSPLHLKGSLHQTILVCVVKSVAATGLLDNETFMLMHQIFDYFVREWLRMKVQARTEKCSETQDFKFKPRRFEIEDICAIDLSSLSGIFTGDSFSEWKELLHEGDCTETVTEDLGNSQEWNLIQEPVLNNVVNIHIKMFGSKDLFDRLGVVRISDAEKLLSFTESYALGAKMVEDFRGIFSSSLDVELGPEHLLRLSLEHQGRLPISGQLAHMYNFYKDANGSDITSMVKFLIPLRMRVLSLLEERDEHLALQKILGITDMLLALPSRTPLAKALSGLQFLYGQLKMFHEDGSKFTLDNELEPILALATSWQQMEFDSWHSMLDEVLRQFEINASKLWFPLFGVLHHRTSTSIAEYSQTTIQSLEEFIRTSNVGEFRKRLELSLAFLYQSTLGISLGSYSGPFHVENRNILYNIFGFYVQCLPIILEHIEASRKHIARELQDLLKLCRWEHPEKLLSIENSKRNRQKLKKLIQKYTEALQQPVVLILQQEIAKRVHPENFGDLIDMNKKMLHSAYLSHFGEIDRNIWYSNWQRNVDSTLLQLVHGRTEKPRSTHVNDTDILLRTSALLNSVCPLYKEEWNEIWDTLGRICITAEESVEIWKDEQKTLVKKRALSDLLKLLETSGLSRHKSSNVEDLSKDLQTTWFIGTSYEVEHLLPRSEIASLGKADDDAVSHCPGPKNESVDDEWKAVNEYYFKSLASMQHLQEICLGMLKDFRDPSDNLQVKKARSFVNHLIVIQQEQRDSAYNFLRSVNYLRECIFSLSDVCNVSSSSSEDSCELSQYQHDVLTCMWKQKELFDTLCALSQEETLLLRTVGGSHLHSCQNVKASSSLIHDLIEKFSPSFKKSKKMLDFYLLRHSEAAIKIATKMCCLLISKEMEQLVIQNFHIMGEFQEHLVVFRQKQMTRCSVEDILLRRFEDVMIKGEAVKKDFKCCFGLSDLPVLPRKRKSSVMIDDNTNCSDENVSLYESRFCSSLHNIFEHILEALWKLTSSRHAPSEVTLEKMTSWKIFFESFAADLQLDSISGEFVSLISYAMKLARDPRLHSRLSGELKQLQLLLDLIFTFADGLLRDFLAVHKMVAVITHALAEIFALLFSKGYGAPKEDQLDDNDDGATKNSNGTGMGEGAGVNDVSEQITNEDQLLGPEKQERKDSLGETPNKNDKGIEMEQDFEADAFSVSEDSANDNGDDDDDDKAEEDEQLDSAMGETGDDSKVLDEKLWDKEDEGNPDNKNEKYELGPSVIDRDSNSRELRGKEDCDSMMDETEGNPDNADDENEVDASNDGVDDSENLEEMNIDKQEAFADPTGLEIGEPDQDKNDDMELDLAEDQEKETDGENGEGVEEEEATFAEDDTESKQVSEVSQKDGIGEDEEKIDMTDLTAPRKDGNGQGFSDFMKDHLLNNEAVLQPCSNVQGVQLRNMSLEENWSNQSGMQKDLAPSVQGDQMEIMLDNPSRGDKLSKTQPTSQLPQQESLSFEDIQPNPLRNIGDALEAWKERVKVSTDIQDGNQEVVDDMMDEDADEYGFTSKLEKGSTQALGSALPDQIEQNIIGEKPDGDAVPHKENSEETKFQNQDTKVESTTSATISRKFEEQVQVSNVEKMSEEGTAAAHSKSDLVHDKSVESFTSLERSFNSEDTNQYRRHLINDKDLGKVNNVAEVSSDVNTNATALWRRYELRTVRLSQELAEQLRLVMEPTLASKLQGDYRTGKRINIKKVIPYIASHYRKDKIWLRRTKPNKRDYQVVIAVDDSQSMSESNCGDVAIEALVTVCRAMSQLEVGKLAVASFGKKGNIRLLHDFDQPFTGEAGIKMISNLTFRQDNMITDEPMADLLTYLNNMLDKAAANARLPSGHNPLEQLVLIIADGRFHEKGKLKRYVRDVLNRKRMVAFLLVDNPQESIMDLMDASFQGGTMEFFKYMNSFPFPYYVVLRDIEALPRTLADLLRQWFELMQRASD